jgi:DNA-binding NarL/FixJ family response regulator
MPSRVVIVDDHSIVRQSLARLLAAEGFEIVGEAGSIEEAARIVVPGRQDIVLVDLVLGDGSGFDVIRASAGKARIVVLTMHADDRTISQAISEGVDGYVLKAGTAQELVGALKSIEQGHSYFSPPVARKIMRMANPSRDTGALTHRELEIITLLSGGARPQEIGESLFISPKTVKNHLTSVYAKLEVRSASQAVAEAYRRGLVRPSA